MILINVEAQSQKYLSFEQAVRKIEATTTYHFYYPTELADSLKVHDFNSAESIEVMLDHLLHDTGLTYLISKNNVIITELPGINTTIHFSKNDSLPNDKIETTVTRDEPADAASQPDESLQEYEIGNKESITEKPAISGYLTTTTDGEPIVGASVYIQSLKRGAVSDANGYYYLACPKGKYVLSISSVGFRDKKLLVDVKGAGTLSLEMEEEVIQLIGATVKANKGQNITTLQMGLDRLNMKDIKQIPILAGEVDIIKTALLLPGVQTVGEGASGFNVRGGSTDQNLILLNDAPIFNSSHFFGFFSTFNADVISDFQLYKSGIPAKFGGRVSSVLDINLKKGNVKNISGSAGISPVFGKLSVEGPLFNPKGSFIAGMRTTYSNWLLKQFKEAGLENSKASFADFNLSLNQELNENNSINLSAYYSTDQFNLNNDTTYRYRNSAFSVKWRHRYSSRLIQNTGLISSAYNYSILGQTSGINGFNMIYNIAYKALKTNFAYYPDSRNVVHFGADAIQYRLQPGSLLPQGDSSLVNHFSLERENAIEAALYLSDEFRVSEGISLYAGYRHSFFAFLGPKTVNVYADDMPLERYTKIDETAYSAGQFIQTYNGPELRLAARAKLGNSSSVKTSYNRMRQYLHMLSNTTAISPTDTWKLSDGFLPPMIGDQVSLGYYHDLLNHTIQCSFEIYGKKTRNQLDYKSGATLILNPQIETDLLIGQGKAYGAELMIRKEVGRLNGWISYTYSRSLIKVDGTYTIEKINNGEYFPSNYDKPHDLSTFLNFRFSRRFSVSSNLTYSTGRPITYPTAEYQFHSIPVLHYSNRNAYRIPDYFRWDMSLNLEGNLKINKIGHSFWNLSVYNLTGRDNVYSIFFVSQNGAIEGYKLSVFNQPIVTLSYNVKF